jgi:hypothetical protein
MKLRHPYGLLNDPEQPIRTATSLFDPIDEPIKQPYLEIQNSSGKKARWVTQKAAKAVKSKPK